MENFQPQKNAKLFKTVGRNFLKCSSMGGKSFRSLFAFEAIWLIENHLGRKFFYGKFKEGSLDGGGGGAD